MKLFYCVVQPKTGLSALIIYLLHFYKVFELVFLGCQSGFNNKIKKTNNRLLGQSAPPDMIFIQGDDTMPSFYMSVCEEPNINYMVYIHWLSQVLGADYPNIVLAALPHKTDGSNVTGLEDPFITNYFSNPMYAFYPVVNLDFHQIERYLSWKTDRLNEVVLIKNGILKINFNQVNEDHFNTEAYCAGQYEGLVKRDLVDFNSNNEFRNLNLNDGVFFKGYRLPTSKEWDYCNKDKFKYTNNTRAKTPFSNRIGFGENYFLYKYFNVKWGGFAYLSNYKNNSVFSPGIKSYQFPISKYEKVNYEYKKRDSNYVSIMNYTSNSYGLINMEGGVKERLVDAENLTHKHTKNWVEILKASGYKNILGIIRDKDGFELEKNSTGKMKYRYFGVN